jgi:hypothetical protein
MSQQEAIFPVRKHELVEVIIPAGSTLTRFYLPDLQNLRNVKLECIEVYAKEDVLVTPTGNPVSSLADMSASYLTLQSYNGKEFLHTAPFLSYHYIQNLLVGAFVTEFFQKMFVGQRVNYPKCYIEFFHAGVPVPAQFSFLLSVYYRDMTQEEMNTANSFNNKS